MNEFAGLAHVISEPLAVVVVLVYLAGFIMRLAVPATFLSVMQGLVFGAGAAYSLYNPIVFMEGVIIDFRALFVGVAAGVFGPIAGLTACLIALGIRFELGGVGMLSGLAAITLSAIFGGLWHQFFARADRLPFYAPSALGLMISGHLMAAVVLPWEIMIGFLKQMGPGLMLFNTVGANILYVMIAREAKLLREAERLRSEAETDPLTGVLNRRAGENLAETLGTRSKPGTGRAIACFDIDNFKSINDRLGHEAGDAVLVTLAARVAGHLRQADIYYRFGGDEFVIVMPDVARTRAETVAERVRCAVTNDKFCLGDELHDVSISVGLDWSAEVLSVSEQLRRADTALFEAKRRGRNVVATSESVRDEPELETMVGSVSHASLALH